MPERQWRMPLCPAVALVGALLVAACGGGDEDGDGDANVGNPSPDTDQSILSRGFVTSFAAFESAAANLRDNVARYVVQSGYVTLPDHPRTPADESGTHFSYPLASSRVEYAHAAGLTGAGQTIALVDDGFLQTHEAFAGKSIDLVGNPQAANHGTKVASIAAGDSATMIGVAPGADLAFGSWNDPALATRQALAIGAVVQNNSWGFAGQYATSADFNTLFVNDAWGADYLDALRAYSAEGVVVFALSNDRSATRAGLMEALPAFDPALQAGWLAVGNAVPAYTNADITDVALFSAGCYEAARWCLLADGFWYAATAASNTAYEFGTGSSFAAPMVSGAMALLAEAFPTLTPHQLRLRLLASADNTFAGFDAEGQVELVIGFFHDYSDLYGHGFLDVRAALLPIGQTTMEMNDGTQVAPEKAFVSTGAAMGDAVARSLEGISFALSDSFSGNFKVPGPILARPVAAQPLSEAVLRRSLSSDMTAARTGPAAAPRATFADFAGQTLSFTDAETGLRAEILLPPESSASSAYGLAFIQPLSTGPLRLDLGVKVARDEGTLLGFAARNTPGSSLAAMSLALTREFEDGAFFSAQAEIGVAQLGKPLPLSTLSDARFSSFGFSVGRRGVFARGDRLALGVEIPTAITSGSAAFGMKVVNAAGAIEARSVPVALSPEEREVQLSLRYAVPLGPRNELQFELVHADNYGNRSGSSDTAGLVALSYRF